MAILPAWAWAVLFGALVGVGIYLVAISLVSPEAPPTGAGWWRTLDVRLRAWLAAADLPELTPTALLARGAVWGAAMAATLYLATGLWPLALTGAVAGVIVLRRRVERRIREVSSATAAELETAALILFHRVRGGATLIDGLRDLADSASPKVRTAVVVLINALYRGEAAVGIDAMAAALGQAGDIVADTVAIAHEAPLERQAAVLEHLPAMLRQERLMLETRHRLIDQALGVANGWVLVVLAMVVGLRLLNPDLTAAWTTPTGSLALAGILLALGLTYWCSLAIGLSGLKERSPARRLPAAEGR